MRTGTWALANSVGHGLQARRQRGVGAPRRRSAGRSPGRRGHGAAPRPAGHRGGHVDHRRHDRLAQVARHRRRCRRRSAGSSPARRRPAAGRSGAPPRRCRATSRRTAPGRHRARPPAPWWPPAARGATLPPICSCRPCSAMACTCGARPISVTGVAGARQHGAVEAADGAGADDGERCRSWGGCSAALMGLAASMQWPVPGPSTPGGDGGWWRAGRPRSRGPCRGRPAPSISEAGQPSPGARWYRPVAHGLLTNSCLV
jgi:hypothetical protein